jgi:hypothetical protein
MSLFASTRSMAANTGDAIENCPGLRSKSTDLHVVEKSLKQRPQVSSRETEPSPRMAVTVYFSRRHANQAPWAPLVRVRRAHFGVPAGPRRLGRPDSERTAPLKANQRLTVANPRSRRHWAAKVISATGKPGRGRGELCISCTDARSETTRFKV